MVLRWSCTICKSETRSYAKSGLYFCVIFYGNCITDFLLILSCRNSSLDGRPKPAMRKFLLRGNWVWALHTRDNIITRRQSKGRSTDQSTDGPYKKGMEWNYGRCISFDIIWSASNKPFRQIRPMKQRVISRMGV